MRRCPFLISRDRVDVFTVDRFQGDENDIIILSLVRTKHITDFLELENRMIVACSRARHSLIILGSSRLLPNDKSLEKRCLTLSVLNGRGKKLRLHCSRHPSTRIVVTSNDAIEVVSRIDPLIMGSIQAAEAQGDNSVNPYNSVVVDRLCLKDSDNPTFSFCTDRCNYPLCSSHQCQRTCHLEVHSPCTMGSQCIECRRNRQ